MRLGDEAYTNHLYADAVQHYQDALNISSIAPNERSRISEKLAYALSLGRDPHAASPLFDRALAAYLNKPAEAEKTIEILMQRARQLWVDARTKDAIPLLVQAVEVAEVAEDRRLCIIANSRIAGYLIGLSRYEDAASYLDAIGDIRDVDDAGTRPIYYTQRSMLAAASGNVAEALEYFEQSVKIAIEERDVVGVAHSWVAYAIWIDILGNIELAKTCYEHALLIARENHIVWAIPHICSGYAGVLFRSGQVRIARDYMLEALSYNTQVPISETSFAIAGIPIALHMKDESLLARCTRESAIDFAFQSGEPDRIAGTAAAFAQWHGIYGREREAQMLLHRAVEIVSRIDGWTWDFAVAASRYGMLSEMPRARALLEARTRLPCSSLAQACISLFDALVAQRTGAHTKSHAHARDAIKRFTSLRWYGYVDLAYTLLPVTAQATSVVVRDQRPLLEALPKPLAGSLLALTEREQQVVELVLKGHTNREIAQRLSIREHTVEKHMGSIMSRLGVRSRHQLVDAVAEPS